MRLFAAVLIALLASIAQAGTVDDVDDAGDYLRRAAIGAVVDFGTSRLAFQAGHVEASPGFLYTWSAGDNKPNTQQLAASQAAWIAGATLAPWLVEKAGRSSWARTLSRVLLWFKVAVGGWNLSLVIRK